MSGIRLTIEDTTVEVAPGTNLLQAAHKAEVYVPSLCAHPDIPPWKDLEEWPEVFHGLKRISTDPSAERPEPGCGLCLVMVEDDTEPVRACVTEAVDGMRIRVEGDDLQGLRRQKLGEVFRYHPHACLTCAQKIGCSREPCSTDVPFEERCCPLLGKCELERVADHIGIPPDLGRYHPPTLPQVTQESLFDRDYRLCIGCTRCVRVCRDVRGVDVLGLVFHEGRFRVGTRTPVLADADCRFCTACVEVCPTGALTDRDLSAGDRQEVLVPCRTACPARTDVPRYVGLATEGRFGEAAAVVRERAPLPLTLGYICFHPCEGECRRGEVNDAVSIRAIKRTAAEQDDGNWKSAYPRPAATGKRVAVIGAGPAGLTASFFLHAAGHRVTLIDREDGVGGMLRVAIPAFRLPREALERELADLLGLGFEVRTGFELGRDGTVATLRAEGFDALLLALGATRSKRIPLPGSELAEVFWGLEFLRLINLGSPPQLSGPCVVVGGGNVAMDAARSAWRLGADPVDLYSLESAEEMPAYDPEIRAAQAEGITIHHRWGPAAIIGEGGMVTGVEFRQCRSVFDGEGRFAPTYDDAERCSQEAGSVILAIGQEIDRSPLEGNGSAFDGSGTFLAGDFASGPGSVIEAIASGRRSAEEIDSFLGGSGDLTLRLAPPTPVPTFLGREEGFAGRRRVKMPHCSTEHLRAFHQVELGLDGEATKAEGGRCLRCDTRLEIRPVPLPPRPWLAFTREEVAEVPAEPGAFHLMDAGGKVVAVVGAPNLRQALTARLDQGESVPYFDYQLDPMYTKLESELLQIVLQQQGEMPGGAFEELDDLF
jgi:NADPH-dependent glutamate synthase beta subunit-like oxidoreductase